MQVLEMPRVSGLSYHTLKSAHMSGACLELMMAASLSLLDLLVKIAWSVIIYNPTRNNYKIRM
jgi:hypothetical protein